MSKQITNKPKHAKGNPGRGGKQPGAGKPKTVIKPTDMKRALGYALDGAQNGTICELMGWDRQWLDGRKDMLTQFSKKRAERKIIILKGQNERAEAGSDTMLIWQGKQHLGQSDKQELKHGISTSLAEFLKELK